MSAQPFSYHTHTTFSDGKNTAEEMISRAEELCWTDIGMTDHLIIHKNVFDTVADKSFPITDNRMFFDTFELAYDNSARNLEKLRQIASRHKIKVSLGYEVDYFTYDGWAEEFDTLVSKLDVDYLISGNHYLCSKDGLDIVRKVGFNKSSLDLEEKKQWLKRHFETIIKAIRSRRFAFIAHLDIMRWLDICGEHGFVEDRREIIKALAETNTAFELSTKGLRQSGDFYPSRWMVEESQKYNVPVVISDDAHCISDLGDNFDKAEALLAELNYTNRWKL